MSQEERKVPVVFECDARASGKMRCDMKISLESGPERLEWELASDEYGFHGGEGTAPLPLSYFAAGLTSCLMTQMRSFSKRLKIQLRDVRMRCRCEWMARQKGAEPYVSEPVGFSIDVEVDSDAPTEDIKRLIEAAKKGCFIEQTLSRANTIKHRLKVGDAWVDV